MANKIVREKAVRLLKQDNRTFKDEYFLIHEDIVENAKNAVLVHRNYQVIYANSNGASLLGNYTPEDVIGKSLDDITVFTPEVVGEDYYNKILRGDYFKEHRVKTFVRKDGVVVDLELVKKTITVGDRHYALIVCINPREKMKINELQDVVEYQEKKYQAKIESERLKEEFFANMSHELKTPLSIIMNTLDLLQSQNDINKPTASAFSSNYINTLKQNSYRLLKLVNNILDVTKIQDGFYNFDLKLMNVVPIIENSVESVIGLVENKGLSIEFDTEDEEYYAYCHQESLDRIVLNLLSNAVKSTPACGSIFIHMRKVYDELKRPFIEISVRDTGVGIDEKYHDKIFKRFKQVGYKANKGSKGSGLGLYIVQSLLELHNGSIELKSKINEGSDFIFKLPLVNDRELLKNHNLLELEAQNNFIDGLKSEQVKIEFSDV